MTMQIRVPFLPRIGSLLGRVCEIPYDWLVPIHIWLVGHDRVVNTLDTVVGGGVVVRLWGPGFAAGIQHLKQFAHN